MTSNNFLVVLDRDGIINEDYGHVGSISKFDFKNGIFALCRKLADSGGHIVVATNQSGIARGYYSTEDFMRLSEWMRNEFAAQDVNIQKVYFCPHLSGDAEIPDVANVIECECRKPKPGMLKAAMYDFDISGDNAVMIGDKDSDMLAAKSAEFASRVFISTDFSENATHTYSNLLQAIEDLPNWLEPIIKNSRRGKK